MPTPRNELADSIDASTGELLFPLAAAMQVANNASVFAGQGTVVAAVVIQAAATAGLAATPSDAVTDQPVFPSPDPVVDIETTT